MTVDLQAARQRAREAQTLASIWPDTEVGSPGETDTGNKMSRSIHDLAAVVVALADEVERLRKVERAARGLCRTSGMSRAVFNQWLSELSEALE